MSRLGLLAAVAWVGFQSSTGRAEFLTTLFTSNNGGFVGGAVYFDLNVNSFFGVTLQEIALNTAATSGSPITLNVYTRPGSFSGFANTASGWTLVSSGIGVSAGNNNPSIVNISDIFLGTGVTGFALHAVDFSHRYTNFNGSNGFYSNADLSFTSGAASNTLFGTTTNNRVFNGTFEYFNNPVPAPPAVYALALGLTVLVPCIRRRMAARNGNSVV
jgi:hypothetical protein